jgi:calcium-dependent protein kinase
VVSYITLADDWGQISADAKSLITKLLTYDPDQRITILEALNDPWIQSKASQQPISNNILKNLSNFYVFAYSQLVFKQMACSDLNFHRDAGVDEQGEGGVVAAVQGLR